jgi:4-amino-4-deoxy-L-arabinose transferase-like glycosyltransferase
MRGTTLVWSLAAILTIETLAALGVRGLFPIDETRYVAVAWEMWNGGDFLVPHLNGEPYSHKPPLLFWLMHAGWFVFGVNEWWPRLIAPLAAFVCVLLTLRLARRLWPRDDHAPTAALLLFGTLSYALYAQMLLFDLLVVVGALLGLNALRDLHDGHRRAGFIVLAFTTAFGLLGKGPVVLLYLLPPLFAAPWWRERRIGAPPWLAIAIGIALALAWALPAAQAGGENYARDILWSQTSERLGAEAPHSRQWWWYLALLPVMLFPWSLWRPHWQALAALRHSGVDRSLRFCLSALLPALTAHTFAAGKQAHYLLPMLPLWALIVARAFDRLPAQAVSLRAAGLVCILLGLLYVSLPVGLAAQLETPPWVAALNPLWGLALSAIGTAVVFLKASPAKLLRYWIAVSPGIVLILLYGLARPAWPDYDLRAISTHIAEAQRVGRPVALWHNGYHGKLHAHGQPQDLPEPLNHAKYHGEFQFYGRLQNPIERLNHAQLPEYLQQHPDALIVRPMDHDDAHARYRQRYRGRWLTLWDAVTLRGHHEHRTSP